MAKLVESRKTIVNNGIWQTRTAAKLTIEIHQLLTLGSTINAGEIEINFISKYFSYQKRLTHTPTTINSY